MRSFLAGFRWAGRGLALALREERNLRVHLCAAFYLYVFSLFYNFSRLEYVALTLAVFGVLCAEVMNAAIERTVDGLVRGHSAAAGAVKDIAAGAVLVFCIGAAACGLWLFWDVDILKGIFAFFLSRPLRLAALAASFVCCGWFILGFGRVKKKYE